MMRRRLKASPKVGHQSHHVSSSGKLTGGSRTTLSSSNIEDAGSSGDRSVLGQKWICIADGCGHGNFLWRNACIKCKEPKPTPQHGLKSSSGNGRHSAEQTVNADGRNGSNGIYVSNIPKSFRDQQRLERKFECYGNISSCNIPTNPRTGESLGYAFVFYENHESSKKAVDDSMKGLSIHIGGQTSKVDYYVQKNERKDSFTNLYVKNFHNAFKTEEDLLKLFEKFGPITSHRIEKGRNGVCKGVAFINYEFPNDAKDAIARLHNRVLPHTGKLLHVSKYETKTKRDHSCTHSSSTQLQRQERQVVRSRSRNMETSLPSSHSRPSALRKSEVELEICRKQLGKVCLEDQEGDKTLKASESSQSSELSESLEFDSEFSESESDASAELSSEATKPNSKVTVTSVLPSAERKPDPKPTKPYCNLYVKNFKGVFKSDAELGNFFGVFGTVKSAKIMHPEYGFVLFQNPVEARAAKEGLHGVQVKGKTLFVDRAQSKEERAIVSGQLVKDACEEYVKLRGSTSKLSSTSSSTRHGPSRRDFHCSICSRTGNSDSDGFVKLDCRHSHCRECLTDWLTLIIKSGDLDALKCPQKNCSKEFKPKLVQALVVKGVYNKYDRLLLQRLLENLDDIVFCPKCGYSISVDLDCMATLVRCTNFRCGYHFRPTEIRQHA